MNKLSIADVEVKGKRILCRVDFNVPLEGGEVSDPKRIVAAMPTIKHILSNGGRLILMSHLGRPDGQRKPEFSMAPVARELSKQLEMEVSFADDCVGEVAEKKAAALGDGDVLLLENLRFHAGEEENDSEFSKKLAKLGEVYVNDAFGTAHRAHGSTEGVTHFFKQSACGFLMKKELDYLGKVLANPERPFLAIMGGAKVKDKIPVLENLLGKVDRLIIGGGMAFTFFKAQGGNIGNSLLDKDSLDFVKGLLRDYADKLVLGEDVIATDKLDFAGRTLGATKTVAAGAIPEGWSGVDIGPETIKIFEEEILAAKTIIWNGPMGVFEIEASSHGTFAVAGAMAKATEGGGYQRHRWRRFGFGG
ncbi:MAG: phosphoglycerate kinase, partial [Planctomycetes bacterium]|nr:phosphoglycerate kinase [Planctomycetota bacterium]